MKTSSVMKWSVAAAVLLGLGVMAASSAEAGQGDDAGRGLQGAGVRHGIRYQGCGHFELVDPDAVEAWAMDNAWRFAKWAMRLDEVRADPEPAIVEVLTVLFPECSWPPGPDVTFGPDQVGWTEAMAQAKEAVQGMDFAVTDPAGAGTWVLGMALRRMLNNEARKRQDPPRSVRESAIVP